MGPQRLFFRTLVAALIVCAANRATGATFGNAVAIRGQASDIALDESRGLLYVANFTANRIDVMSLADSSIQSSMNVAPQPGALALSADSQFLLISHYGGITPSDPTQNGVTLINLKTRERQTFRTGDVPLGVAFLADNTGLIVTTSSILFFDPASGIMQTAATFAGLAQSLPVDLATFPSQVILATVSTSPDHRTVYGIVDDGGVQGFFRYDMRQGRFYAVGIVAAPKPLPRLSVSADGSFAMVGMYKLDALANNLAQFPNATQSVNIGGNAIDSKAGVIYAQIVTGAASSAPAVLSIMDADNLSVRESIMLPENITGRMILNSAGTVVYAVSDSGVLVLPVGKLNQSHRVTASTPATASDAGLIPAFPQASIAARGSFCNRTSIIQKLRISDPSGGNTDFTLTTNQPGVTITPSSGTTPADVQVLVDTTAFQDQNGTVTIPLTLTSQNAVNVPPPIRLLVNNRNPDQRGTFVDVPGTLTDLLADPQRNRFYIVAQDRNLVLVFDSRNNQQIAALRTSATPTSMAITFDQKMLIVGHDNSQQAYVWDLDTLKPLAPIQFPSGHYPHSFAASGNTILALVRNVAGDAPGVIDRVDLVNRTATQLPTLGIFKNNLNPDSVLAASPNGSSILVAAPDGNVLLYDSNADSFIVSRKDSTSLSGAYAASSFDTYVVGNKLLNGSLVPIGTLDTPSGVVAGGFAFVDQTGVRTSFTTASSPGIIQRADPSRSLSMRPTNTVEAPLGPTVSQPFIRTLAPLFDRSGIISLTVSGFTVLPWDFDSMVAPPVVTSVVSLADGTNPLASGGLVKILGQQLSSVNISTSEAPLPTSLGESCVVINNVPMPLISVSNTQINGQIPFNVDGSATLVLRTPGGVSDNFSLSVLQAAPSIFRNGEAGPLTGLATVVRAENNDFVTLTNPIRPNDNITIYATGLGRTSPSVDSGAPSPSEQLASAIISPQITLGGVPLTITFAGLLPGYVGVYQINATVPFRVPQGLSVPLMVSSAGKSTTLDVRVVN